VRMQVATNRILPGVAAWASSFGGCKWAHLDTATKPRLRRGEQPRANGNADFQIGRYCGHERAGDAGAEPGAPVAVSRCARCKLSWTCISRFFRLQLLFRVRACFFRAIGF